MLRRIMILLALLSIGLVASGLPAPLWAQGDPTMVVLHNVVVEDEDGAHVRIFFTLRQADGLPVPADQLAVASTGRMELGGTSTPATVGPPADPLKIALVIDASGSMNLRDKDGTPLIDEVRAAAARMIDAAPPNAEFAVFIFADGFERLYEGFRRRDQADQIKDAINTFKIRPAGTGDTCLYDAASRAIDALSASQPGPTEQLSLILFTDGKDREAGGAACGSTISAPELIRKAKGARSTPIPIYTIGVCTEMRSGADACANVNRSELTDLAKETLAFPVIGPRAEVDALFGRLMEGLKSQWVAEATLCPPEGSQSVTLIINQGGKDLPEAVPFIMTRACLAPPTFEITGQEYAAATDSYTVTMAIGSPGRVGQVTAAVFDYATGGARVSQPLSFENPSSQLTFSLPSTGLKANQEYFLRVSAFAADGTLIKGEDGGMTVALNRFTYRPTLDFQITSVEPDWAAEQIVAAIKVTGAGGQTFTLGGELRDPETGQSEALAPVAPQDGQLRLAMPPMLRTARESRTYVLSLNLDAGGQALTRTYTREITPPESAGGGLPIWVLAVALAALAGGAVSIFLVARRGSGPPPLPKPYSDATVLRPAAPSSKPKPAQALAAQPRRSSSPLPARPASAPAEATELHGSGGEATELHIAPVRREARRLRLKVLRTPAPGLALEQTLGAFPLLLGRDQGHLTFRHDPKVSRRHVEVTARDGAFTLADLGATNGTWVGDRRLAPGEAVPFDGPIMVRLGPDTEVEMTPEGM